MRKNMWKVLALSAGIGLAGYVGMAWQIPMVQAAETAETTQSSLVVAMSQASGCYEEGFLLKLSCDGAVKIYYTLDGSNPITSDTRQEYTTEIAVSDRAGQPNVLAAVDPVLFDSAYATYKDGVIGDKYTAPTDAEVDKATIVKAVAQDSAGLYTKVVTNTYFVGKMTDHIKGIQESSQAAGVPLSIMSISIDYDDLFDYDKGIYVKGKVMADALLGYTGNLSSRNIVDVLRGLPANYNQKGSDWEREAHIDYMESDGTMIKCLLQQDCGIRTQGNYSRSDFQKGFRLYARADYGEKNFKHPFFGDALKDESGNVISKFKKINLRNGGNNAFNAKFNDAYWQSLLTEMSCATQAARACIVYLNGEYWGIYLLQEDYDETYFETHFGVDKDTVVTYKGDAEKLELGYELDEGDLPEGVTDQSYYFKDLLDFFASHKNLKSEEDYKEFEKLVDVDSVRDYFAGEVWLNNKWDWPGKNWLMWKTTTTDSTKTYADGRWRMTFYDLDFGGFSGSGDAYANTIKDSNYKPYGLLDMDTDNPSVLCFAYLMTNENFRKDFANRLKELDAGKLSADHTKTTLDTYKAIYEPLYPQYFARFFGTENAAEWSENAVTSTNGGYKAISDFISKRSGQIQTILDWVENFYDTHNVYNSSLPDEPEEGSDDEPEDDDEKKTISKCKVTARSGKKIIKITTIKKAKVTVTLTKKIIVDGKKKTKTITIKASKNKAGKISIQLSSKLKKGMKIKVKVSKNGYKTKSKQVKVS